MNIYQPKQYDEKKILDFLKVTNDYFVPHLSERVNLEEWSKKLYNFAVIFEQNVNGIVVGLGAMYFNYAPDFSFGAYVCVKKEYQKEMYGVELIEQMIDYAKKNGSQGFRGEIRKSNKQMVKFYKLMGLEIVDEISIPSSTEIRCIMQKNFKNDI